MTDPTPNSEPYEHNPGHRLEPDRSHDDLDPDSVRPVNPLARHVDPSLQAAPGTHSTPRTSSVEWVRPAELQRRLATRFASMSLTGARRFQDARRQLLRRGVDGVRGALARRQSRLAGPDAPATARQEAPRIDGPGL